MIAYGSGNYCKQRLFSQNRKIHFKIMFLAFFLVYSIRCYQCSTQTDVKGVDSCGAYKRFNSSEHIAIECNSDESHMPGSFCMKVVQQGPRGFICKYYILIKPMSKCLTFSMNNF